jgi:hypothetical protein
VLLAALLLVCSRAWAYIVLLALLEVCWAAACVVYARLALLGCDLITLYWALAWLVFAAVELALNTLALISYAQLTGQSTLAFNAVGLLSGVFACAAPCAAAPTLGAVWWATVGEGGVVGLLAQRQSYDQRPQLA